MSDPKPHVQLSVTAFPATVQTAIGICAVGALKVFTAALAVALAAHLRVWVPSSPVPITLQTLAVLLTGFLLGARLAPAALLVYLALGAAGLPFFAVGLVGPTGGYLIGFVFAAALVGRWGPAARESWLRTTAVAAAGTLVVFAFGLIWLAAWMGGGWWAAFMTGVVPFWPGATLKIALAVVAVRIWRRSALGSGER